jgi:hypothetical protein
MLNAGSNPFRALLCALAALALLATGPAHVGPAFAQGSQSTRMETLRVAPGGAPAVVSGLLLGNGRTGYSVQVRAGERLTVSLRRSNRALNFSIFSRSGASVFESRGERFSAVMRRSGTYAIILQFDRDAPSKRGTYALTVSVSGDGQPGGGGFPDAPGSGGDFVRVVGIAAGDTLAVRAGPGTVFDIVGELTPQTRRLRLGECRRSGGATWCVVSTTRAVPLRGWVNARYLGEDG